MRFQIAVVSERRHREVMEDAHSVVPDFNGNNDHLFAGVFDGHGSHKIAVELSRNMADLVKEGITAGMTPKKASRLAYAKAAQAEWAQVHHEGSCAATLFLQGSTLTCANVGDCRIITVGESVNQLTRDHDTKNKSEVRRVKKLGAKIVRIYVELGDYFLAVTRAIGDIYFEEVGLIHVPFTCTYELQPNDKFIVAASDGLFGKTSNEQVLAISNTVKTAEEFAEALKKEVERRDGSDNVTIVVVQVK